MARWKKQIKEMRDKTDMWIVWPEGDWQKRWKDRVKERIWDFQFWVSYEHIFIFFFWYCMISVAMIFYPNCSLLWSTFTQSYYLLPFKCKRRIIWVKFEFKIGKYLICSCKSIISANVFKLLHILIKICLSYGNFSQMYFFLRYYRD